MRYFTEWHPCRTENEVVALIFGFLRHAPSAAVLDPWLSSVLGRQVSARIEPQSFWPQYYSAMRPLGQRGYTEPDLVFSARSGDGERLAILIEAKIGTNPHRLEQVRKEVVDVAAGGTLLPDKLACVLVGQAAAEPPNLEAWTGRLEADLARFGFALPVMIRYASFDAIADRIMSLSGPGAWQLYASDVLAQMKRLGLGSYKGAPMLDEVMPGLTVEAAVRGFNEVIRAAQRFLRELHGHPDFLALGFEPFPSGGRSRKTFKLERNGPRDGRADAPGIHREALFDTTVLLTLYSRDDFSEEAAAFVGFRLTDTPSGGPEMWAGLVGFDPGDRVWLVEEFAEPSQDAEADDAEEVGQDDEADGPPGWEAVLPHNTGDWRYDWRPWRAGEPADDFEWTIDRLRAAAEAIREISPSG